MRLFKCDTPKVTITIIDLPKTSWRYLPPKKWQVTLALATIAVTAIIWGILG